MKQVEVTTTVSVEDEVPTETVSNAIEEMLSDVTQADGFETVCVDAVSSSSLGEGIESLEERIGADEILTAFVIVDEVTQDGPEN